MTSMNVAQTILAQLGGKRFIAMTGASSFTGSNDTLSFRLPPKSTKHNAFGMRIKLDPSDTYRLTLLATKKGERYETEVVDERDGIYDENLQEVFTDMTGLYTRL